MKVLWFTNIPAPSSKKTKLKIFSGGWIEALEKQINKVPGVQLYISYYSNVPSEPFKDGETTYLPVLREKNIIGELRKRTFNYNADDDKEQVRLLEVVNKIKPDVIHVHGTEDNFGLIQTKINQPVVISIQGLLNPYFEKFFSGVSKSIAKRNEPLMSKIFLSSQTKLSKRFEQMASRERDILKHAKHIIGRTNWDRRVTSTLAPLGHYHHNDELLRDDFYKNVWLSDKGSLDEFRIISTSSNGLYKGFEAIVKTAMILQNLKGFKFTWNVVGLSENDSVVKLVSAWLKIDLKKINIKLLGKMAPKDFIPLMLDSNLFCQVSHIENSPNSLCEAMCVGMPIVATFAGGTDSILKNNVEGLLIQDGDSYSMAGAILEIENNPIKSIEMAQNARMRALDRHNPAKVAEDLVSIYKLATLP